MLHPEELPFADFSLAERHHPAESDKPPARAESYAGNARQLPRPVRCYPFPRDEIGRQNDPKDQHAHISHDAYQASHEGRMRVEPLTHSCLKAIGSSSKMHRRMHRLAGDKLHSQEQQENKTEELHCCLDVALSE